ncbi:MAG: helix-turn-helix domain-containing protein [Halanaerobiales bacterium]
MGPLEKITKQLEIISGKLDNINIPDQPTRIFSVEEAADYLKVSKNKIYELIREKKLGYVKVGTRKIITQKNIEKFLADNEAKTVEFDEPDYKLLRNIRG